MSTVRELLSDMNAACGGDDIAKVKGLINENQYIIPLLQVSLMESYKMKLPPGAPPYEPSEVTNEEKSKGVMWQVARKLTDFCNPQIHPIRRESMFVDALESVTNVEAELLIKIKDGQFNEEYPNITLDHLIKAMQ